MGTAVTKITSEADADQVDFWFKQYRRPSGSAYLRLDRPDAWQGEYTANSTIASTEWGGIPNCYAELQVRQVNRKRFLSVRVYRADGVSVYSTDIYLQVPPTEQTLGARPAA